MPGWEAVPGRAFALVFVLALLAGAVDHTATTLGPRRRGDVYGAAELGLGVFLSGGGSAGWLIMLLIPDLDHPERRYRGDGQRRLPVLYIVYGNLSAFFATLIAVIIGVAMWLVRIVVDHLDGAHVCGTPSRATTGCPARVDQAVSPRYRTPVWLDRHHQRAGGVSA